MDAPFVTTLLENQQLEIGPHVITLQRVRGNAVKLAIATRKVVDFEPTPLADGRGTALTPLYAAAKSQPSGPGVSG